MIEIVFSTVVEAAKGLIFVAAVIGIACVYGRFVHGDWRAARFVVRTTDQKAAKRNERH